MEKRPYQYLGSYINHVIVYCIIQNVQPNKMLNNMNKTFKYIYSYNNTSKLKKNKKECIIKCKNVS